MKLKNILLSLVLLCSFTIIHAAINKQRQVKNLEAFTKLYGYIRFFYPSDEAQTIDWDRFAVYGSKQMINAKNDEELKKMLNNLFLPVAPALNLYPKGKESKNDLTSITPPDSANWDATCWQFKGYEVDPQSVYMSRRTNRSINIQVKTDSPYSLSVLGFAFPFDNLAVKKYKLSFSIKAVEADSSQNHIYASTMWAGEKEDSLSTRDWERKEYIFDREYDETNNTMTLVLQNLKKTYLAALKMEALTGDKWEIIYFNDFSNDALNSMPRHLNLDTNIKRPNDSSYNTFKVVSYEGKKVLCIESSKEGIGTTLGYYTKVYKEEVPFGTYVNKPILKNLYCSFPLSLHGNMEGTYPPSDVSKLKYLKNETDSLDISRPDNLYNRLGDVIIYWNFIQHFYPYWQYTDTNWQKTLDTALEQVLQNPNIDGFEHIMLTILSQTKDGHAYFSRVDDTVRLPGFKADLIEDKWIVSRRIKIETNVPLGSEIKKFNGKSFRQFMDKNRQYYTKASKQNTDFRLFVNSIADLQDSSAIFTFKTPGGMILEQKCELREGRYNDLVYMPDSTREISPGIYYVNLTQGKTGDKELAELYPKLAQAKGIIFDWRSYPSASSDLISHMMTTPDTMHVIDIGKTLFPDHESVKYEMTARPMWWLEPKEPHLSAKIVFLCGPMNISYNESFLNYLQYYKLATIIGEPTAGTTGNVEIYTLPGKYKVWWTGMFIQNPDGSRFHGIGIIPEIIVHPTIKGISENKDEVLDKAMKYMRQELSR